MSQRPWSELSKAEKLQGIRHSSSHVMAQTVLDLVKTRNRTLDVTLTRIEWDADSLDEVKLRTNALSEGY